jgi:hypothetical protein
MKPLFLVPLVAAALLGAGPFTGRWDLTVTAPAGSYPGWMEFTEAGGAPQVRVQPRGGSVRPARDVKVDGARMTLTLVPAGPKGPATTWELSVAGGRLTGTQKRGNAEAGRLEGVRAPELKRQRPSAWADPEPIFNGRDLTGWEPIGTTQNNWVAQDGALLNKSKGANLRSTRKFDDFKLHIEFNCPEMGNSGIYLRGRYEIQVEYEPAGAEDRFHGMGSIYGMVATTGDQPRRPGTWESFDITLIGRWVTIARNGTIIIDNQEIAGITGGALDSNEGEPGPFYFQGDHTGGMLYRNITVQVPKR